MTKMNRPLYNDQASQPVPYLTLRDTVSTVSKIKDGGDIFSKSRRAMRRIRLHNAMTTGKVEEFLSGQHLANLVCRGG